MENRFVIVCYDIPDTRTRNQLIDLLFSFGLARIQYSVFSGYLPIQQIDRMNTKIQVEYSLRAGRILIVPICKSCISRLNGVHMDPGKTVQNFLVV